MMTDVWWATDRTNCSLDPAAGVWWCRLDYLLRYCGSFRKTCLSKPPFYRLLWITNILQLYLETEKASGCVPVWIRRHLSSVGSWCFLSVTNNLIYMFLPPALPLLPSPLIYWFPHWLYFFQHFYFSYILPSFILSPMSSTSPFSSPRCPYFLS